MTTSFMGADAAWPLWRAAEIEGAFLVTDDGLGHPVVTDVRRPWLFRFAPAKPNGRGVLVLGGGGYTALMVGREGSAVTKWLTGLGYNAYVLVHRFPNAEHGPSAPLDDAIEAMRMIRESGAAPQGVGVLGLSSGGHLAACLAAAYPQDWSAPDAQRAVASRPDFLIVGYAPVSTNAKGRTVLPDKPPLEPSQKQALYDALQPDAQLLKDPPPTFIVYAGNDPIVPVTNAFRLYEAVIAAGGQAEIHVFADAPHGFAMDTVNLPVSNWPSLCEAWLVQLPFLANPRLDESGKP